VACSYDDAQALEQFAASVDLITYEFENVPVSTARFLQDRKPIYPPPAALEVSQDRFIEKSFLRDLGIATPAFAPIDTVSDAHAAHKLIGLPAVLKTRRMGYDGKGQRIVRTPDELTAARAELGDSELILEEFVLFSEERSLIAVRSIQGETQYYPLVENVHQNGILRTSRTPSVSVSERVTQKLQREAEGQADAILTALQYVGALAIEYFVVDGSLVANEIAPRVHNSGHWTIEGAETSQFENHLRAILDLPLGSTNVLGHVGMINIIGDLPNLYNVLQTPGAHLHLYDKSPRPNRKIGHITIRAESAFEVNTALERLATFM
jgi:5-(carboxyamino)imidazole ribonucleotide synthase